jgi:hypothetical protein
VHVERSKTQGKTWKFEQGIKGSTQNDKKQQKGSTAEKCKKLGEHRPEVRQEKKYPYNASYRYT